MTTRYDVVRLTYPALTVILSEAKTHLSRWCIACLGLLISAISAVAIEEDIAERCALCHDKETQEWRNSRHALAMGESFLNLWERENKKRECLVCHTSQFDRKTGKYSHEGITCESCHGAFNEKHPDDAKMVLPVNSEVCQSCHSITYGEWRVSAHGQKNIRCFDCHKMHQMAMRKEDPDQMCGTCHAKRLESFSHATHAQEGLHCISCHMPRRDDGVTKIRGVGVRGHTTGVGAETCAKCHAEMVHSSSIRADLQEEVQQLKSNEPERLTRRAAELQAEIEKLQHALHANRRVFVPVIIVAFALGLVIGYAVPHVRKRGGAK